MLTAPAANQQKVINPLAIEILKEIGIDISGNKPKSLDSFLKEDFNFVITFCDRARDQCPAISENAVHAHWGIADPAYFEGSEHEKLRQVERVRNELMRRIDIFLALPLEKSDHAFLKQELNNILRTG